MIFLSLAERDIILSIYGHDIYVALVSARDNCAGYEASNII